MKPIGAVSILVVVIVAFVGLFAIGGSFYSVDQGELEAGDIEYNNLKIDLLKADNEAHKAEVDIATKVAKNINDLIGGV